MQQRMEVSDTWVQAVMQGRLLGTRGALALAIAAILAVILVPLILVLVVLLPLLSILLVLLVVALLLLLWLLLGRGLRCRLLSLRWWLAVGLCSRGSLGVALGVAWVLAVVTIVTLVVAALVVATLVVALPIVLLAIPTLIVLSGAIVVTSTWWLIAVVSTP